MKKLKLTNNFKKLLNPADRSGMTLFELLAVVLIGSLLLSMLFLVYTNSSKSLLRQDIALQQLTNLRSGLAAITRDLRSTGNGYRLLNLNQEDLIHVYTRNSDGSPNEWYRYAGTTEYGVKPIHSVDSSTAPDEITLFSLSPDFATRLGELAQDFTASSGTLRLRSVMTVPTDSDSTIRQMLIREVLKPGDAIAIVPPKSTGYHPIILESLSDATNLTEINFAPVPSTSVLSNPVPEGSEVFNVKRASLRRFWVKPEGEATYLMLDTLYSNEEIVAEGIEDLQLGYYTGTDSISDANMTETLSGLDVNPVKAVRIVLVGRTIKRDTYSSGYPKLVALNHNPSADPPDGFPRRKLDTIVQLRNY
jgi:type II secretory pathway pseudopilin PulG